MFKLIKNKIIIAACIVVLLALTVIASIFVFKSNIENNFEAKADKVIEVKWESSKRVIDKGEGKEEFIFNYSNLSKPKAYQVYTLGDKDPEYGYTIRFIKFDLKFDNFMLVQDGESRKYAINSGNDFDDVIKTFQTKSFTEIEKKDDGNYISNGTPELTDKEIQKNKEAEKRNDELNKLADDFYNSPVEDRIANRRAAIADEENIYIDTECKKGEYPIPDELKARIKARYSVDNCMVPLGFYKTLQEELVQFEQELAEKNANSQ